MKEKIKFVVTFMLITILLIGYFAYNNSNFNSNKETITIDDQTIELSDSEENYANVTLDDGTTVITLNNSIIKADSKSGFSVDGSEVVQAAARLLGKSYDFGKKGGGYSNSAADLSKISGIDCSGLVAYSLNYLGYKISGFGQGSDLNVPLDCMHWQTYTTKRNSIYSQYMREIGLFTRKYDNSTNKYENYSFETANDTGEFASTVMENYVNCNKSNNGKINALKVNDPITSDYRYYEYYDSNGQKKQLPMGTIVVAYGGSSNYDHAWITIGDLGTTDANEAAEKLVSMGIINESQTKYVYSASGSTSTYWRIESNGTDGVVINNGDPDYLYQETDNEGRVKEIGPIWAFQVANEESPEGSYNLYVGKKSEDNSIVETSSNDKDLMVGATISVTQWENIDENAISYSKINANSGEDPFYQVLTSIKKSSKEWNLETKNGQWSFAEGNDGKTSNISNTEKVDVYRIVETSPPNNYAVNKEVFYVIVTKTQVGSIYKIKSISVKDKNGNVIAGLPKSEVINGKQYYYMYTSGKQFRIDYSYEDGKIMFAIGDKEIKEVGNYNVNLVKKGIDGTQLGRVLFTASAVINGESTTLNSNSNPLITSATEAVSIGSTVTIDKSKVGTQDKYTLKEYNIGNNSNYYIGIDKDIILTVDKTSTTSEDGSLITNSVTGISLAIEGGTTTNSENKSTVTLSNGSTVTAELVDSTITITVENPLKQEEGSYDVKLVKKGTDGTQLGGVSFTVSAKINGVYKILNNESNPLKTSATKPTAIGTTVTIDKDEVAESDVYTLRETDIGNNEGYYIGIDKDIILTVNKASTTSSDGSKIINSVTGISLAIEGGTTTNTENTSTVTLSNGSKVTAKLDGSTITITVENPLKQEKGSYNVRLIKKGTDGTQLGGVLFTVSAKINGVDKVLNDKSKPLETSATKATAIGTTVTIDKDKVAESDIYTLRETNIGDNEGYYIGIDKDIVLTVNKTSTTSTDGSTITNSVTGISLAIEGGTTKNSENTSTVTLSNGSIVTAKLDGSTITITVENPLKQEEGSYNVRLIKEGTDGTQLGGVLFTVSAKINGVDKVLNDKSKPLETSATKATAIGTTVTIDKDKIAESDVYTLREFDIGDNEGYYIGIDKDIVLTVNKTSTTSADGSTIINSVTGISLAIEGETTTNSGNTSTVTLSNGSIVTAKLNGSTITITVENPEVKESGDYSVRIIKEGTDGKVLAGVKFTASAVINGENNILNDKNNPLITETISKKIGERVTIDRSKITTPDVYTLNEYDMGTNEDYYIGIDKDIKLTVYKTSTTSADGSTITNSASKVELEIEGGITSNSETISRVTLSNGSTVTATLAANLIILKVKNPKVQETGNYSINLVKKGTDGTQLGGVTFTANATINGTSKDLSNITTNGNTTVQVGETVEIDKKSVNTPDKYILRETDIGNNEGYYIGIDKDIVLTVNKISTTNEDGSTITNSIDSIELAIEGGNAINNGKKSTVTLSNGSKVTAILNDNTIEITVENPKVKESGEYSINLIKKGTDGTVLTGVKFTASAVINGKRQELNNEKNPLITENTAKKIGETVTIDRSKITIPDVYTLKEYDIGTNEDYYIGIDKNIKLTVNKISTTSENGSTITNSIDSIELAIEGGNAINNGKKSTVTLSNGSTVTAILNGNTIEITVENPKKKESGEYSVNLVKKGTDGQQLGDVAFSVKAKINGKEEILNDEDNLLKTQESSAVAIKNSVTIEKDNINTEDIYTLREYNVGKNSGYYIGIDKDIVLTVSKTSTTNTDGSEVTNSVSSIRLSIDGETAVNNGTTSTIELDNGSKVIASLNKNTITITVENPTLEGEYKINLVKKDANGKSLSNIPFKINEVTKYTDSNGNINVSKDASEDGSGTIKITKDNLSTADVYKIEEIYDDTYTNDFVILAAPITLSVNKGFNYTEDGYQVKNVEIKYTTEDGEQTLIAASGRYTNFKTLMSDGTSRLMKIFVYGENGKIELTLTNPEKTGKYSLQLEKVYLNENDEEQHIGGVAFEIVKNTTSLGKFSTESDGYTNSIECNITKDDVDIKDVYRISEKTIDSEEAIVKLKRSLLLTVTKKVNNTKNGYTINTVKLESAGTSISTPEITVEEGKKSTAILKGVELQDGRTVDIDLTIDESSNILIKVRNRTAIGNYTIKVKKFDESTNEAIGGVGFKGLNYNQIGYSVTTSSSESDTGVAIIDENNNVTSARGYTYTIEETSVPDDYLLISDFRLILTFNTKLNSDKTKYVIDEDTIQLSVSQKNGSGTTDIQREIIEKSTFDVSDNVVTINVYNRGTTDFDLSLRKANLENNTEIQNAKFTIIENGTTILDNQKLSELPNGKIDKQKIASGQTYTYEIYENEPATGYDNIFVTNTYSTHLVVTISTDINGNATAKYRVIDDVGGVIARLAVKKLLVSYTEKTGTEIIEQTGNSFKLNIPNPYTTTDINVKLNKYVLGSTEGVDNAVFGVRKLLVQKENSIDEKSIIDKFNSGTGVESLNDITTKKDISELDIDSLKSIEVGDTYYYELYEKDTPNNFDSKISKAIVRVNVDINSKISASVIAVLPSGEDEWQVNSDNKYSEYISTTVNESTVNVNWANEIVYYVQLFKKGFEDSVPKSSDGNINWNSMEQLSGTRFTLVETSPESKTLWDNKEINGTQTIYNDEAGVGTTYNYTFIENSASDGYYNLFEGMYIYLTVKVKADGSIDEDATSIRVAQGTATSEAYKIAKDLVELKVSTNHVEVYIANKKIKNTFDIKILKVADEKFDNNLVGVEGVEFDITGAGNVKLYDPNTNKNYVTDEDGYIDIINQSITSGIQHYVFSEASVPEGVTKLESTNILLNINTSNLTAASTPEEIAEELAKDSNVTVSVSATSADGLKDIEGLNVQVQGTTIILTIPNPTKSHTFELVKNNSVGGIINNTDGLGSAEFRIYDVNEKEYIYNEQLSTGTFMTGKVSKANTTYVYRVEEESSKAGYDNILEGWYLYVYATSDENALVKETQNKGLSGETYFKLVAIPGKTQKYTEEEILNNNYITLTTKVNDEKTKTRVMLNIVNPYEYKLQLNKKDKDGTTDVKQATILAEKVTDAKANELYYAKENSNSETVTQILKEIATSKNTSDTLTLNKEYTVTSKDMKIDNNVGMVATDTQSQTWRITETDVSAPYYNILSDKYIIATTYYREDALHLSTHRIEIDGQIQDVNYYVTDKNGNDLTDQYLSYVDVTVEQIDGEWTVVVTVKDPMKVYVDLNKVENDDDMTPLEGAQLKLEGKNESAETNGKSSTSVIGEEIGIGETITFTVTESSTTTGHINILEGKILKINVQNDNGTIKIGTISLYDAETNKLIIGNDRKAVMDYITISTTTNKNGYTIFHIYVKNPIEYVFKLQKLDGAEELLEGAQIKIVSSNSGTRYLNKNSSFELVESGLSAGDVVFYTITEQSTVENSAYVNVFKNQPITVVVGVNDDGSIRVIQAAVAKNTGHGSEQVSLKSTGFGDCTVSDPDEDGVQTVNLIIENPTQFDFELIKKSSGNNPIRIEDTKFTIESSYSGVHEESTDENGEIEFRESPIEAGSYEYKITEDEVADKNYINILEGLYIKEYINVAANGSISFDQEKLGRNKPYKVFNQSDDTEVTDSTLLSKIYKYVTVNIDRTNAIQKLVVTVKDPVTIDIDINKVQTDGTDIPGTEFTIQSSLTGEMTKNTDDDGNININEGFVDPGIYKYVITENNTAGAQYYNVLKDCRLVVYVKVSETGLITFVSDESGSSFSSTDENQYNIETLDGSEVDEETEESIHKHVKIKSVHSDSGNDYITINVENTVNYQLDIIKKDADGKDLSGTKFTVYRDKELLLDNADITTKTEITEENMEEASHEYYITENSSEKGHINILEGKFIKVYADIKADGKIVITDSEANNSKNYFEIYEGNIANTSSATLLDKNEYADLYDNVYIEVVKGSDNVYTLNVQVKNPERDVKITLNKKIFGSEGINLANTEFTIKSTFSGDHAKLVTDKDGNLSFIEKGIPAGTYKYYITETATAGDEFINILDNMYVEVIIKVNEDGTIQILDENGNASDETYYLYEGQENSTIINRVHFNDTVVDNYVKVRTTIDKDLSELNIYIQNPEFYNFELVKKDKDTNDKMNGVKFTLKVYDENDEKVDLINAETLEKIVGNTVTTKNVNGVDGVISIQNILIPKAGIYTYVFHEESTDGIFDCLYKSLASDIHVDVEIVVQDNEYVVKQTTITQGNKYVESASTSKTKAQTSSLTVLNERIKGSYDLTLIKLDSYTKEELDGAKFDVTVSKDGEEYELYKVTDDVTSKEIIIPESYTVTNGELKISNIRIDRPETYRITLTETEAPTGYMLLDEPIVFEVTTGISGENDDAKYVLDEVNLISGKNHGLVDLDNDLESITVTAENEYFDLSLRKSITSISYEDGSQDGEITEDDTQNRVPNVITSDLLDQKATTAIYNHSKIPVRAYASQYVIYTLRVYNEGEIDGYAEEISDHLPEYLEYVDDEFNESRDWVYDEDTRTAKTTYLSQEKDSENNLIKAMNKVTGELDYKEIQIKCKISENAPVKTILTNIAEISISKANNRTSKTVDRDSTTNNVNIPKSSEEMSKYKNEYLDKDYVEGQEDDDDFEKVIIEEFDLALRKYIIAVNDEELLKDSESNDENNEDTKDKVNANDENSENTEDKENTENVNETKYEREPIVNVSALKDGSSTTATYTHTKEPVEVSVGDIVTYTIEVFNEGTVSGYASLIKDDIPEGVEFVTYEKGDGSTNDIYRWKMVDENDNEVTDPSKAKYVVSDYLSKANEESEGEHLLNAYDYTSDTLDSKYVRIAFRVTCKQDYPKIITNYAQISEDTDESGKDVKDRDSTPNEWKGEDDEDIENIKVTYMDLALRKFITAVNEEAVTSRIPQVDATALIEETGTTATYTHTKDPVLVHTTDIVTYTLRVYNEGSKDGYATQIKDDIPDGLEFVIDNEVNKAYGWTLVDENDNEVTDISKAKYVVTNYLSKENEKVDGEYMMKAFDKDTMDTPDYREVKIAFRVVEPTTSDRILINYAQISKQTDGKGVERDDRDSTPNEWKGEDDEDIEKVKVLYFDLALRKWVTQAIVIEDGKTSITETGHQAEDDPEAVVKVDLKKSKISNVVVKFRYSIRITNEGEIAGEATEISDYIPNGLKFVQEDNPDWKEVDGKVVTSQLAGQVLEPGESAEVEILLTWVNDKNNMGVMINTAEISKDYNKYDTPDIDSTPNNKVTGEDDIDDAPVMLTVKTGEELTAYVCLALGFVAIIVVGVVQIKKKLY